MALSEQERVAAKLTAIREAGSRVRGAGMVLAGEAASRDRLIRSAWASLPRPTQPAMAEAAGLSVPRIQQILRGARV